MSISEPPRLEQVMPLIPSPTGQACRNVLSTYIPMNAAETAKSVLFASPAHFIPIALTFLFPACADLRLRIVR
jgi:hypothetical protein